MALVWLKHPTPTETVAPGRSSHFDWDSWYQRNRQRLSEKKAKRYREDQTYREAALQRSRAQRHKTLVPAHGFTVSFQSMAQTLGVTEWVLREWRRKNYFPEPQHRDGRLWFHPNQQFLLGKLKQFFDLHGNRVRGGDRSSLDDVVQFIYANW